MGWRRTGVQSLDRSCAGTMVQEHVIHWPRSLEWPGRTWGCMTEAFRKRGWVGSLILLPLWLGPRSPWVHPGNIGGCGALRQDSSCVLEPGLSDTRMGPLCSPPQYCCSSEGPAGARPRGNSEFSLTLQASHLAPPWP